MKGIISMKYYIFGSNKIKFKQNTEKALFSCNKVNSAHIEFESLAETRQYSHMYLVADFDEGKSSIFTASKIDGCTDHIPFVIIEEYHDGNITLRQDDIFISYMTMNVTKEYYNNRSAFEYIDECIENNKIDQMKVYLRYENDDQKLIKKKIHINSSAMSIAHRLFLSPVPWKVPRRINYPVAQ